MRLLVLDFLAGQNSAVSLTALELGMKRTDRVTLYRTLKTFEERGLAHAIDDGSGAVKYALCQDECTAGRHNDRHIHFHCSNCMDTCCLPAALIPAIQLPQGFRNDQMSLVVQGLCAACNK